MKFIFLIGESPIFNSYLSIELIVIERIRHQINHNIASMPYFAMVLIFCSILGLNNAYGQTPDSVVVQKLTPLLDRVMEGRPDLTITLKSSINGENIDIGVPMHTNHVYVLLRTGDKTFARIGATGITYSLNRSRRGDSVVFRRIDETTHFGYNIDAFEFSYADRLYNIGGYGYWRWNGQLREFNGKMKQWQIIPLDRELPLTDGRPGSFSWLDKSSGQLYVLRYMIGNEAEKNNPLRWADTTVCLDLRTGVWTSIGNAPFLKVSGELPSVVAAHDSGLVVTAGGNIELWNYRKNKVYVTTNDSMRAQLLTLFGNHYLWFERDQLLIGDAVKGTMDSIRFRPQDFVDTGRTIYAPLDQNSSMGYLMFGGVLMMGGMFWLFRGRFIRKFTPSASITKSEVVKKEPEPLESDTPVEETDALADVPTPIPIQNIQSNELFDAVERSLLALLHENDLTLHKRTSTQEVNRKLGVGNKTLDMQKRKRSDVIRAINRKFQLIHPGRSSELIMKNRSDLDGRLSEYYLNPAELTFIKTYIDE